MNQDQIRGRAQQAKQTVKRAADQATISPLMESLLRLGYMMRGVIYGMIGLLALQVVVGGGGALTDPQGAIAALGRSPVGTLFLYVILVGLVSYGLWGLIRAFADPQHNGTRLKGIAERIGYAVSGVSYLLLGFAAYNPILGGASTAHNGAQTAQIQQTTGSILSKPGGPLLVALGGAVVIVVGLLQIYRGSNPGFDKQFKPYALKSGERKWIIRFGRLGMPARGLIFTLIGIFLILAAVTNNPSQAQGIDGVLASLLHQPAGTLLLGVVALGLIAFGIYSALCGFWLRLKR